MHMLMKAKLMFSKFTCIWHAVPRSTIDDEYAHAAEKDPKILITTSRNPSAPLTQFAKVAPSC